jgi:hypothetical protein
MPVQRTSVPARSASGQSSAPSQARLLSAVATLHDALTPGQALNVPAVLNRSALLDLLSVLVTNASAPTPVPAPDAAVLPRCLGCGHRTADPHPDCVPMIGTYWVACLDCHGSRTVDGRECRLCCGVGFIDETADVTLAEKAGELVNDDEPVYYVTVPAGPALVIDDLAEWR